MQSMQHAFERLVEGLRAAGAKASFEPMSPEAVQASVSDLPISADLLEWYALGAPNDIRIKWFALTLTLHHPSWLAEVQNGYRWIPGKKRELDPSWGPGWLVIGDWDGDAAIAHTDRPGTPISMWLHDADREPFLIAPDLRTFLAAVGIFAEVVHGKHKRKVFDEDANLIPEVEADLDQALAPRLAPEHRQHWVKPV